MPKKILIADDSATAIAVLTRTLSPLGHELIVACDGEEAERLALEERPDLVILDVIMPKLHGFQLCRKLREHPATHRTPIIFVTAVDRESDRFWGLKQGANEYLTKPVDPEELVGKVRLFLG